MTRRRLISPPPKSNSEPTLSPWVVIFNTYGLANSEVQKYQIQSRNEGFNDINNGYFTTAQNRNITGLLDPKYLLEGDQIFITPGGQLLEGTLLAGSSIDIQLYSGVVNGWAFDQVYPRSLGKGVTVDVFTNYHITWNIGEDITPTGYASSNIAMQCDIQLRNVYTDITYVLPTKITIEI